MAKKYVPSLTTKLKEGFFIEPVQLFNWIYAIKFV